MGFWKKFFDLGWRVVSRKGPVQLIVLSVVFFVLLLLIGSMMHSDHMASIKPTLDAEQDIPAPIFVRADNNSHTYEYRLSDLETGYDIYIREHIGFLGTYIDLQAVANQTMLVNISDGEEQIGKSYLSSGHYVGGVKRNIDQGHGLLEYYSSPNTRIRLPLNSINKSN